MVRPFRPEIIKRLFPALALLGFVAAASRLCLADDAILQPQVAGQFYPNDPKALAAAVDGYLDAAQPPEVSGHICALIAAHAGYDYSGPIAAHAYKLIRGKPYTTVVVMGTAHRYPMAGVSVLSRGSVRTPLGEIPVDERFAAQLLDPAAGIISEPRAFAGEHSMEVQLPFLQRALGGFRIVPVVVGDCALETCRSFARAVAKAAGNRGDVLIVASTDLYHGYDYDEAAAFDSRTLDAVTAGDAEKLYYGLRGGNMQACGGFGIVIALLAAPEMGCHGVTLLNHTNSAVVTGKMQKGIWTVGYAAAAVHGTGKKEEHKSGGAMLNTEQRKKLLAIARSSVETYLKTGKKLDVSESDPLLSAPMGAFVTLTEGGRLRGCIGTMTARAPLHITVRDMAVEAALRDPRFAPVRADELKDLEIEISVLSPFERVSSADAITPGTHGVMVKKGFRSGVFLPQVATETGWTKEEFLNELCSQKAGLAPDAWKDPSTELYIFTAEVFSERHT